MYTLQHSTFILSLYFQCPKYSDKSNIPAQSSYSHKSFQSPFSYNTSLNIWLTTSFCPQIICLQCWDLNKWQTLVLAASCLYFLQVLIIFYCLVNLSVYFLVEILNLNCIILIVSSICSLCRSSFLFLRYFIKYLIRNYNFIIWQWDFWHIIRGLVPCFLFSGI